MGISYRIIHRIVGGNIEYALIEISHNKRLDNPSGGWCDGIFVSDKEVIRKATVQDVSEAKLVKNALLTDHSGNLLSSTFFNPNLPNNNFKSRRIENLIKEFRNHKIQEGGKWNGISIFAAFSWTESSGHLNILQQVNFKSPYFADASAYYDVVKFFDPFSELDKSTFTYQPKVKVIPAASTLLIKPIISDPRAISETELMRFLWEVVKPIVIPTETIVPRQKVSSFAKSILGKLNLRMDEKTGKIDFDSLRDGSDVEGIMSALFTESEVREFLLIDSSGNPRADISLKEWIYLIYQKVMVFEPIFDDRISNLISDAKALFEDLGPNPISISDPDYVKYFSPDEVDNAIAMVKIIEDLFGHATIKLIGSDMVDLCVKGMYDYRIEITTRPPGTGKGQPTLPEALGRLGIIAPSQSRYSPLTDYRALIRKEFHFLGILLLKSSLVFQIRTAMGVQRYSKDYKVDLRQTPLNLIYNPGFTHKNYKDYAKDLDNHLISLYTSYYTKITSSQGILERFCESNLKLSSLLAKIIRRQVYADPDISFELKGEYSNFLINRMIAEVFMIGRDPYRDGTYPPRKTIEDFLNDINKYSTEVQIKPEEWSRFPEPYYFRVTRDDFIGYEFEMFGDVEETPINRDEIQMYVLNNYGFDPFKSTTGL